MGLMREQLDPLDLYALAGEAPATIGARLENDLQAAALRLRPELQGVIDQLHGAGALGAQVSGSGPTVFGLFPDLATAEAAAAEFPHAVVTMVASR
jgi:4-diphosphocytidyl-2-C-methyl-D-erythritol kinase